MEEKVDNTGIEEYLISNLSAYVGEDIDYLKVKFGITKKTNKNTYVDVAYKMAGVASNRVDKLSENNILIKTIRLGKDKKIKESMSFPAIKFKEFAEEEWGNSTIYNYFSSKKFLFVIYEEVENGYKFLGGTFWKMPSHDLNNILKEEWNEIHNIISNGVSFEIKKDGKTVGNSLPKKSQTKILHLRPKAKESAYFLKDGFTKGNIKRDADELPNGEFMTRQCFWLNNDYVLDIVEKASIAVSSITNTLDLDQTSYELLSSFLIKDFYTIDEFKRIFFENLKLDDERYFNAYNIAELGYSFNFNCVYSNKYDSLNQYIETLLLSDEVVSLGNLVPELPELNNYNSLIDELVRKLPVFRVDRSTFISADRLDRNGINGELRRGFVRDVIDLNNESYFTIKTLQDQEHYEDIFDLGFEDCFYEDILFSSEEYKSFIIGNKRVFCLNEKPDNFCSLILSLLSERKKMDIFDLQELLSDIYDIRIEVKKIKSHIRFSDFYYNQDIEKIYLNYNEFIMEVKTSR